MSSLGKEFEDMQLSIGSQQLRPLQDMRFAHEVNVACRLNIGSVVRAQMQQTSQFNYGKDAAESMRARATFCQTV